MNAKKRRLGKGLDALLGEDSNISIAASAENSSLKMLAIDLIERGPFQPRRDFDQDALDSLADSIKTQGLVQPILVRPVEDKNSYEIVAGERRWRAAQIAGLHDIPVIIKDVSDNEAMCIALIENIQRQDLNPLEEAGALERLINEFEMTHDAVAETVGRSRPAVSNLLRLLELDNRVKKMVETGKLDMGHARALLSLSPPRQLEAALRIVKQGLSVRATENLVKQFLDNNQQNRPKKDSKDSNIARLESDLSERLAAKVSITHQSSGQGKLQISYNSLDELQGILKRLD
ncbi:MAG: ParB/RepB/Spo0J family partition protein [Pseudomonadota bacterium]|nr:ParB/RepB/Spo0J family partition protein [Pseudomonadota bacterium]